MTDQPEQPDPLYLALGIVGLGAFLVAFSVLAAWAIDERAAWWVAVGNAVAGLAAIAIALRRVE